VKLDRVATTLIGPVTAVGGLLAVFGVNNERVNLLLDDDSASQKLIAAGISAALAVVLSLFALMARELSREVLLLSVGAVAYVAGLVLCIFAAAGAADFRAYPAITDIAVQPGSPATLTLTVRAGNLDEHESLKVIMNDSGQAAGGEQQVVDDEQRRAEGEQGAAGGEYLYSAVMRPDSAGQVQQKVSLAIAEGAEELQVQAWRLDTSQQPPGCESGDATVVCVTLTMP